MRRGLFHHLLRQSAAHLIGSRHIFCRLWADKEEDALAAMKRLRKYFTTMKKRLQDDIDDKTIELKDIEKDIIIEKFTISDL